MSLLVVKNQEISQEILIFIYLKKKRKAMQRLGPDTAVGAKDARLQQ